MLPTGLVSDPGYLEHDTGPSHPESPQRLSAILSRLHAAEYRDRLSLITAPLVDRTWLETVHTPRHIDGIARAIPSSGLAYLDADTPVSPGSYRAALKAVGGTLAAIDAVMTAQVANAFCAVRPPGHHAEPSRAMGFCLFNNVAVGARYAQRRWGLARVLILDWDVHHGNGTQVAFYDDPTVLYVSLHQYPWYPGSGSRGCTLRSDQHFGSATSIRRRMSTTVRIGSSPSNSVANASNAAAAFSGSPAARCVCISSATNSCDSTRWTAR